MGWKAIYRTGNRIISEDDPGQGRPVDDGNNEKLSVIAQEDFGHKVAIDLVNGVVALEYETLGIQNGSVEVNPRVMLWICEETNIVGELRERKTLFHPKRENGHIVRDENKRKVMLKTDYEYPLIWRPIWFTRYTNGVPAKVIGAQTTLPEGFGGRNIKKMITLFSDGRLGID